jgi:phospholipid/cholesterol/gamma-HCH transport system permease protein
MATSEIVEPPGPGRLSRQDAADHLLLSLAGRWDLASAEYHEAELRTLKAPRGQDVRLDLGAVDSLDTAGAWLLYRLAARLRGEGHVVAFENVRPAHDELIQRLGSLSHHCEFEPPRVNAIVAVLERIGATTFAVIDEVRESVAFLGLAITHLALAFVRPHRLRVTAIVWHMEQAGLNAVPIVALVSFLIGVVIAFQGAIQLSQFGAEVFVVDLVAVSVLRELGILLTAIIVAGRSGSAFAAQIGSMKINEEIDAMRTLGLDPMHILVVPRLIALAIVLPLLGFLADIMGLVGGGLMVALDLGISPGQFLERLDGAFEPWSLGVGLIKAPVFAGIIALTGCYMGLKVSGSAESLGRYTTRSVVHAIFMVIVVDAAFSIFFSIVGI